MKTIFFLPLFLFLMIPAALADNTCEVCATYKDAKECVKAEGKTEADAKAAASAKLSEKFALKDMPNFACSNAFQKCTKACPQKRAKTKLNNKGMAVQSKTTKGPDPLFEKCRDNCTISKNRCVSSEKKAKVNRAKRIASELKLEEARCSKKYIMHK